MGKNKKQQCLQRLCTTLLLATLMLAGQASFLTAEEVAPIAVEDLFRIGMEKRETGKSYDSIEIFHSLLSSQPSLHRARLELAVAYYRTLQFDAAIKHANEVLADPDIPKNVRLAILAFLAQAKTDKKNFTGKHYWSFPLSAGIMHDSNVTAGPSSSVIPGSNFTLTPSSLKNSDWAKVLSAGLNHTYTTGNVLRFGDQPSNLIWQNGINYYHRGYREVDGFDLNVLTIRTGPGIITPKRDWRANVTAQWDDIYFGGIELADYYSLLPSITWHKPNGSDIEITFDGVLSRHDYHREIDTGRDSNNLSGRLSCGYAMQDNIIALQGGALLFTEDADINYRRNDGWGIFAGVVWNPTKQTSLYGRANYKFYTYEGIEPGAASPRDEDESRYVIGASQTLWKDNKTKLALKAEATFTDNDSNIFWYDYDRTQGVVSFDLTF